GVHVLAGGERSSGEVVERIDRLTGHGVGCVSAGHAELAGPSAPPGGGRVRLDAEAAALTLFLGRPCAREVPRSLAAADNLSGGLVDHQGALSAADLDAAVGPARLLECASEGAHLQLDIDADGAVIGVIATAYAAQAERRPAAEACLAERAHALRFPAAPNPTRALYALAPRSSD